MRWCLIQKSPRPATGTTYKQWKPFLADEGRNQCVYCALPDNRFGGQYNFHVEHFEPKSLFPQKINEWTNLFYCCAICNVFKSNDWPSPGSPNAYLNPTIVDYCTEFDVDDARGWISGRSSNSKYMVERLYLNRPQLIFERREAALVARIGSVLTALDQTCIAIEASAMEPQAKATALVEMYRAARQAAGHLLDLRKALLYAAGDVKRP